MKSIAGRRRLVHMVIYTILIVLALSMAFPYYWMVVTTFKTSQEVYSGELRLFPSKFSIEVYEKVLSSKEIPILRFFANSMLISLGSMVISVGCSILAAFSLSRFKVPGGFFFNLLILSTMMVPGEVVIVGIFMVIRNFKMIDTYQGVILPLSVYAVIFMVLYTYMKQIPRELDESAFIDGANHWQVMSRIIVPISIPVIYSAILLAFLHAWQNFTIPYILTLSHEKYPLAVGALFTESQLYATMQETLSVSTLLTIPVLILFILTQRFVFSGITAGSVKG